MNLPKPTPHPFASLPTRRELAHRIALLEARISDLELSKPERTGPKPIKPIYDDPQRTEPQWPEPRDMPPVRQEIDEGRCHICQGRFSDMTGYVCGNTSCPNRVTFTS